MLAPGATIGILGGGQLGRMTALAAARLGYRCHIFCPDLESPAAQVCDRTTLSDYDDRAALAAFAASVDVVTYEFENVPVDAARALADQVAVHPHPDVLATCQDRVAEKRFVASMGIQTAPFAPVDSREGLAAALADIAPPAVLKTTRFGYDGKGQAKIDSADEAKSAWQAIGGGPAILEGFVPFIAELSVIAARGADGAIAVFPPGENVHANHILKTTLAPADRPAELLDAACAIARRLIAGFDMVGLLAVELFLLNDGRLLVNEMAPRPHNSGHWTQDGARTDQFEQLVRAVTGLPLGDPSALYRTEMTNFLGGEIDQLAALAREAEARVHHYGKALAKPGRKMGHVNRRIRPMRD